MVLALRRHRDGHCHGDARNAARSSVEPARPSRRAPTLGHAGGVDSRSLRDILKSVRDWPKWRNGRRAGLKIRSGNRVWVQVPPSVLRTYGKSATLRYHELGNNLATAIGVTLECIRWPGSRKRNGSYRINFRYHGKHASRHHRQGLRGGGPRQVRPGRLPADAAQAAADRTAARRRHRRVHPARRQAAGSGGWQRCCRRR